ncbi:MAG: hypothetical protein NTV70_11960 [Acidobacteria bacterium]|nr:hypothetical protein [Acidobacteriota bacterium]
MTARVVVGLAVMVGMAGSMVGQSGTPTVPAAARTVTVNVSQDVNAPADSLRIRFRYLDVNRSADDVIGVLASNQISVTKDDLVDVGYQSAASGSAVYPYYSFDIDIPVTGFSEFFNRLARVNSTQQNSAVNIVSTNARVAALNEDKRAAVLADLAKLARTRAQALVAAMPALEGTAAALGDLQSFEEFISFNGLKATVSLTAKYAIK